MTSAARFPAVLALSAALCFGCGLLTTPRTSVVATDGVTITAVDNSFALEANKPVGTPFSVSKCPHLPIGADEFPLVEQMGGKRVRVTYPGVNQPLYGILLLCQIPKSAVASESASYRIQIPKNFVDATEGGKISLVHEGVGAGDDKVVSWLLYLSRTPFAASRPPS